MREPGLVRQISLIGACALVVSNTLGQGIFTSTGFLIGQLGSPTVVISIWIVGALLALVGALCYSELGVNFQRSGGEYIYLSEAWGPAWGFIDGWVSFFAGFSAPIATAALAISAYLSYFYPALEVTQTHSFSLGILNISLEGAQLLACCIVAVLTLLNLLAVDLVAKMQNFLTTTKLIVILAFLVLGFGFGDGDWTNFDRVAERTTSSGITMQFAISLVWVYTAYSGWNAAVYVAEEIRNPAKNLPIALITGTIFVAIIFIALNILYIYAVPPEQLKNVLSVGAKSSSFLFGPTVSGFFSVAMAVSLLATVNAMCMVGPRVYYAMAKRGAFFSGAAKIHPRWKSPWVAVLYQGACCMILILTGTFESLVYYVGFTLSLFSALSVLALFKFRKYPNWKKLPWVSFGYPFLPTLYVTTNLWIFLNFAPGQRWASALSFLTVVSGALLYRLYRTPSSISSQP
ncbi:MAG: amino acid permease [Solibacterales bacterium]|nr:amino acid permease [Bryobacterales bacterium]|tara:strand:- start:8186 stop:9565 length:1380 start_codon:yes stop_codon:yes gene_type:complete